MIVISGSAASIHVIRWANYLAKNTNWEVVVFSKDRAMLGIEKSIKVELIPKINRINQFISAINQINRLLKSNPNSIVQVHSVGYYGLIGLFLKGKFLVVTPWGSDIHYGFKNILKKAISLAICRKADLITTDSLEIKNILSNEGLSKCKIRIINFGVDISVFNKRRQLNRSKSRKKNRCLRIVSTRNFELIYDIKTLIDAVSIIVNKGIEVRLDLIGHGSQRDNLENYVREKKMDYFVKFHGTLTTEQIVKVFSYSDVYVSTSLSDAGLAASTAEAMASKLICVVTDVRINSYWIREGHTGFLFKPGDYLELADKLEYVYFQKDKIDFIGDFARRKIVSENNFHKEMDKVKNLYQRLINE